MDPIRKTSRSILSLPLGERREAISDVVNKARNIKLDSRLLDNLQQYLNATTPPTYSPTFNLEQVHGWTQVWGAYNGGYSLWSQFATDPKTGVKTFVQQHKLHTNPQAAQVTAEIAAANNRATTINAELEREYQERLASMPPSSVPSNDLRTLINDYNKIASRSKYGLARAYKNNQMKLSRNPFERSSVDMFAGILRGSNG